MKHLIKHMEAAFAVALGLACAASFMVDAAAPATAGANISTEGKMAVVTVKGKRMSEQQKQQSLREERAVTAMGDAARQRS